MAVEGQKLNLDQINSEDFVKRLKARDSQAFDQLFDTFLPKLVGFLSNEFYEVDGLDLEEACADALLKVYNSLPDFDVNGKAKLTTWIFKIAINTTIDHVRRTKVLSKKAEVKTRSELVKGLDPEKQFDPFDVAEKHKWDLQQRQSEELDGHAAIDSKIDAMSRALNSMEPADQSILRLRLILDYEQIAEIENAKPGTLRVRHKRAMEKLEAAYLKELIHDGRKDSGVVESDSALEI